MCRMALLGYSRDVSAQSTPRGRVYRIANANYTAAINECGIPAGRLATLGCFIDQRYM